MKPPFYRFSSLFLTIFFLFALAACAEPTPTPSPLPVPNVPPIEEVDSALSKWNNGNNMRYSVTVEETTNAGIARYRIVIADGVVRVAQQQAKVNGEWQTPVAFDLETAENYTIDALFARIRNDALGLGIVPMDMNIIFDPISGFPSVVDATALPTYNEEGHLQLNRDLGYTLVTDVKTLIEDTAGVEKDPILYVTRSGGEQAWCDTLRVYPNGSSVYTDDCREVLLQLTPPTDMQDQLMAYVASLSTIDETQETAGVQVHLILSGDGTEAPNAATLDEVWSLGRELAELLSHPIGAGITLLYSRQGQLYGYDMRAAMGQPANVQAVPPVYGMVATPDGKTLAYADSEKLYWMDLQTGDTGVFFSNLPDGHYVPRGWNRQGQLLLQRVQGTSEVEWGWTSREDASWHAIPLPAGAFQCDTGISMNPNAAEFVIAAGDACENETGLTLIHMNDGSTRKLIDAQSVPGSGAFHPAWSPDGTWIVFSLTLMDTPENPQRVFLVRADGTELTPLTNNTTGEATHPIWASEGARIFYALHGADTDEDGIYAYDLSGSTELILPGAEFHPVSISPSAEFLVYSTGAEMKAYLLRHEETYSIVRGIEDEDVFFVGWLDTRPE
jgi:hypothetical protein